MSTMKKTINRLARMSAEIGINSGITKIASAVESAVEAVVTAAEKPTERDKALLFRLSQSGRGHIFTDGSVADVEFWKSEAAAKGLASLDRIRLAKNTGSESRPAWRISETGRLVLEEMGEVLPLQTDMRPIKSILYAGKDAGGFSIDPAIDGTTSKILLYFERSGFSAGMFYAVYDLEGNIKARVPAQLVTVIYDTGAP